MYQLAAVRSGKLINFFFFYFFFLLAPSEDGGKKWMDSRKKKGKDPGENSLEKSINSSENVIHQSYPSAAFAIYTFAES